MDQTNQLMKGRKCKRKISYGDTDELLDFIHSENTDGNDLQHNRMQKKASTATFDKCESPNHGPCKGLFIWRRASPLPETEIGHVSKMRHMPIVKSRSA